ncbi:MAG: minichromosome maintenance protein MCM [Candidatus Aenigmatarchaeota archaeon]
MDNVDLLDKFVDFLNEFYKDELVKVANEGKKSLNVDFSLLEKFDVSIADYLLENPIETLPIIQKAARQIDVGYLDENFRVRFFNLPENRNIRIRNIRAEHIGKMIVIDGIVKRASEVRPEVSEAIFQCLECGSNLTIIQTERIIRSPAECENPACRNRKAFKLVDQKLYDARWVTVEEPYEVVTGEKPSTLMIYFKEDLTSPKMQNKTDPGNRIKVTGVLKELPRRLRGTRSRQMEIYLDANYVESVETVWEELEITPEDEQKIIELSKDPELFTKLIASIAPTMYGMEDIKEAILLQLFGTDPKILKDRTKIRGNINILLIGDPASGKSQLMQLATKLIPRGRYVSGSGVTAAGITATVVRDEEFLGGWVLEAGALVMANKSICAIDEFSKVSPQDRVALQEAMSMETISIAKASIVATLPAQTAVLAGGNPKLGRFDPYIPIKEQIDIDDVLLSRFDLKFALRDIPNPEIDEKVADHILKIRQFEEIGKPLIDPEFMRKYIAYARTHIHPVMTETVGKMLKEFYLNMRARAGEEAPIAITLRQYESLLRLAEASARVRLSNVVEEEDAQRAIKLMKISLRQFGFEPETGMFDIDRAEGAPTTAVQRSRIRIILDALEELEKTFGKEIPSDEIVRLAKDQGVDAPDEIIKKMQQEGIIFSPRPGIISKV